MRLCGLVQPSSLLCHAQLSPALLVLWARELCREEDMLFWFFCVKLWVMCCAVSCGAVKRCVALRCAVCVCVYVLCIVLLCGVVIIAAEEMRWECSVVQWDFDAGGQA